MIGRGKTKTVFVTVVNDSELEENVAIGVDVSALVKDSTAVHPPKLLFAKVPAKGGLKIPVKIATKPDTDKGVYRIPIMAWIGRDATEAGEKAHMLGAPRVIPVDVTVRERGEGSLPKVLVIYGTAAAAGYAYLIFKKIKGEKCEIIPPWRGV